MGIFDRLGDVIRSYLNDEDGRIFGRPGGEDSDMAEAEAELESFLRGEGSWTKAGDWGGGRGNSGGAWADNRTEGRTGGGSWTGDRSGERTGDGGPRAKTGDWGDSRENPREDWAGDRTENSAGGRTGRGNRAGGWNEVRWGPPEQLRPDFEELGLPFGAGAEECKAAYRRLLKLHHPDRHAGHQGNMEKATRKMAKINAAYDRIERWRAGKA